MTDALHFPLMFSRDGLDPIAELRERRENEPVSKLELPFGITAWLVTGYDAAKEVLARRHLVQQRVRQPDQRRHRRRAGPGRPGDDRPAVPHPAAQDADAGIHHAPAAPAAAADRGDRRPAAGRHRGGRPGRRPGGPVRDADPVAGDLRAAGRALRGPGGVPGAVARPGSTWATIRRWTSSARRWTTCRPWW